MVNGRSLCHLQASLTTAIWQTTDELAVLFSWACPDCQLKLLEERGPHQKLIGSLWELGGRAGSRDRTRGDKAYQPVRGCGG